MPKFDVKLEKHDLIQAPNCGRMASLNEKCLEAEQAKIQLVKESQFKAY